jgi:probable blue pigment (indigoidine) exporter
MTTTTEQHTSWLQVEEPSSTPRLGLVLATALAPIAWGTTYIVSTELLPADRPLLAGLLRALPAGIGLAIITRTRPIGTWWIKAAVLGALNIGGFFALLFYAAFRLPGGVAGTLGAIQPLIAVGLAAALLNERLRRVTLVASSLGVVGVALLVLRSDAELDSIGILAGLAGAASMAVGVVLTKRWGRPVPLLAFTSWQLIAGGLVLLPLTIGIEGLPSTLTTTNLLGFAWLATVGTAVAYSLWFRGIQLLPVAQVSILGLLSPLVATLAGWIVLGQTLSIGQLAGAGLVLGAVWLGQTHKSDDTHKHPPPLTVTTPTTPTEEGTTMTNPISYQQSVIVDRPADEVWASVADYAFDLQWRDGLTDMTPTPGGPPQTGSTVHEELRSMGTTMVNDTTITMTGDHAYRFVGGGASGQVEGGREVTAVDPERSQFTYEINLTLNGPIRFVGFILRPILSRNLKKDLQRFRTLVEASAVRTESAHS